MVNAAQTIEIHTGDPDWDAAFALSQKTGFGLFFGPSQNLPNPSFVITRQPDQGYSPRGDGSDYSHLWDGQPILEACTLASLLPGAPELAAGLVRNYLAAQSKDGKVDSKPGLAGQRGHWLATPLLATPPWQIFQRTHDLVFLKEVQPNLEAFFRCWLNQSHDRDGDGFPEWDHPLQTGLEDSPSFSVWQVGGAGAEISTSESPSLAALLCREAHSLAQIAGVQPKNARSGKWNPGIYVSWLKNAGTTKLYSIISVTVTPIVALRGKLLAFSVAQGPSPTTSPSGSPSACSSVLNGRARPPAAQS